MTPEAQRIAIAEACGWIKGDHEPLTCPVWRKDGVWATIPPDYLNDLNAMHEAEKTLKGKEGEDYFDLLGVLTPVSQGMFAICHASSAIRAEAFLKVKNIQSATPQAQTAPGAKENSCS